MTDGYSNVFVLCTGRCGSTTFLHAAKHISNYTSSHGTRRHVIGPARTDYPPRHIEIDGRLSWFLGRLERRYGDSAFYVHLLRDAAETARSYARRFQPGSIMSAYASGIYLGLPPETDRLATAADYVETVNANIESFLANKTHTMTMQLETAKQDFAAFLERIGAEGDIDAAVAEWDERYNASPPTTGARQRQRRTPLRIAAKLRRAAVRFPAYVKDA